MIQMTRPQLVATLLSLRGATFTTLQAVTVPKVYAACPFKGNLYKVSTVNGTINFIYQNSVNAQRIREGLEPDFEAFPRQWGDRIPRSPLIVHVPKGEDELKYYLEVKVEKSITYEYQDRFGNVIPKEQVTPWLYAHGRSRQQVEKEVILRDYEIENIRNLTLKGEFVELVAA